MAAWDKLGTDTYSKKDIDASIIIDAYGISQLGLWYSFFVNIFSNPLIVESVNILWSFTNIMTFLFVLNYVSEKKELIGNNNSESEEPL